MSRLENRVSVKGLSGKLITTVLRPGKTRILLHVPKAFANIPEFQSAVRLNTG